MALLDLSGIGGGSNAGEDALAKAQRAQEEFMRQKYNEVAGYQRPFAQQGTQAFGLYQGITGANGLQAQQDALSKFRLMPQEQFAIEQNLRGLNQNAAAKGQLFGGNRLLGQATAQTQGYQNALNNYIERLRAQAGLGAQAVAAQGGVSLGMGQGITNAMMGYGDARANSLLTQAQQQAQTGQQAGAIGGALLAAFSDERLKENIVKIGERGRLNIYKWTWNKLANELGLFGGSIGHIAQEVKRIYPDLIIEGEYLKVIYGDGRTMEAV